MSRVVLTLLFFSLFGWSRADNTVIELPQNDQMIKVSSVEVLVDSEDHFSIEKILAEKPTFIREDSNLNLKEYVNSYWLKLSFVNNGEMDEEYLLDFDKWSDIHLFLVEEDHIVKTFRTGHLVPFNERNYQEGNKNLILIPALAGDTVHFYVHLQKFPDNLNKPVDFSFSVGKQAIVDAHNSKVKQIIFLFVGIILVMFLYHLFVYLSTNNQSYLLYLGVVGATLYMTLNNSGYIVSVFSFWNDFPNYRAAFESMGSSIAAIFMILFTRRILQTKINMPRMHKVLTVFIWAIVVLTIGINVVGDVFTPFIMLVSFLLMAVFITVGILAVVRRVPSGGYYLLAYTFSMTGIMILFMAYSGSVEANNFTLHYAMPLGYSLEMIFYSLALGNVINVLKRENDEKQERIIEQLVENEQLANKVNRELESKVAERTQEISEQKRIIEAEKEKSDSLLLNILPSETAEELKTEGKATPKRYQDISILFTDFVDFTHISKMMSTEELVQNLHHCFSAFDDIVAEFGLEKIKTIGDAYMCAQGLAESDSKDPAIIVEAALKMRDFIDAWNEENEKNGKVVWPIRIGINTGTVSAGVVGKRKFSYDIWGDSVNLAARMESASHPGKVNISQFTREKLNHGFELTERGDIPVKNYGEVTMFFVEKA